MGCTCSATDRTSITKSILTIDLPSSFIVRDTTDSISSMSRPFFLRVSRLIVFWRLPRILNTTFFTQSMGMFSLSTLETTSSHFSISSTLSCIRHLRFRWTTTLRRGRGGFGSFAGHGGSLFHKALTFCKQSFCFGGHALGLLFEILC